MHAILSLVRGFVPNVLVDLPRVDLVDLQRRQVLPLQVDPCAADQRLDPLAHAGAVGHQQAEVSVEAGKEGIFKFI